MAHSYKVKKISDLIPYVNNSRTHSDEQVTQIASSIKEFGFTNPVLIDEQGGIIAGHGRILAAKKLSLDSVPTITLSGLTDAQRKAYVIADNQLALNAGWDLDALRLEIENLQELDFDIDLLGFEDDFLDGLLESEPSEGLTDEDEVPDAPETPVTVLGDLWVLGNHRLLCGDSTSIDAVEKLMDGQKAEILFTSPPYSDMREYNGNKDLSVENLVNFIPTYFGFTKFQVVNLGMQIKEGEVFEYWQEFIEKGKSCGYKLMAWNIWHKTTVNIGQQKQFFPCYHEWIFVFGNDRKELNRTVEKKTGADNKKTSTGRRQADGSIKSSSKGDQSNSNKMMESVFKSNPELGSIRSSHPATFPVELPEAYIGAMTSTQDNIIEPFCGSGTTLIACEKTSRNCYGMELDPKYCDVIINRWQDYTGKEAIHIESGKIYDELKSEKGVA